MNLLYRLRKTIREAVLLKENPHKIALGMAIGVFISFTPFFGLHTVLAIACAFIFRTHKLSTIAGAWVNLPWIAPFVYIFSFWLGKVLLWRGLGLVDSADTWESIRLAFSSWAGFGQGFVSVALPLLVGTTHLGLLAALGAYFLTLRSVRRWLKEEEEEGRE
jgi:hypothetical protein